MKIIILGTDGRLGAALMRQYRDKFEANGFNHARLDLSDLDSAREKLHATGFDVLVNTAAFTNVDLCETQREQAFRINAEAPRVLAEVCSEKNAKLIHFSTDYVFDGEKSEPYTEQDEANPISIYGESKLAGEKNVLAAENRHLVVRVSWVFGPDRPSFIDTMIQRAQENEEIDAVAIFAVGYFVQTAPWDWDNLKLMVWGYFLILPFLWSDLIARWAFPERAVTCMALFASGFITLLGGLSAGHPGFGLIDRARLDAVGAAVRPLPVEARFAAYPTYNHPLLLQGRKVVLGYPGHLWTEGFDYANANNRLTALMRGAPNWREAAQALGVRYIFWGRDEMANYQGSSRPWEATARRIASGDWGAIYDLGSTTNERK
jgi:hypothetical protein